MDLQIKGIIPPMLTPLDSMADIDEKGVRSLVAHLLDGGIHGLFILGTNGEAPGLSYSLRKEFISLTCELVNKRVPVLVGITDTSFEGSLEIANHSKEAGADAVVVAPPYYMPITQKEMQAYLGNLSRELPLPFLLYNIPSHTKLHLAIETVKKAKELGALGIKDSSGDMLYLYSILDEFKDSPEFSIITGTELFMPELIMNGGHGAIAGGANIFPRLFVDLYNAAKQKNFEKVAVLRQSVMRLYKTIYNVGNSPAKIIIGIKCALSVLGICNDYMAPPLTRFSASERKKIEVYLGEIKELL